MGLFFEWDNAKAHINLKKHKVSFEEAATIYDDPLSLTITDSEHSSLVENRFISLGMSVKDRLLVVVHCDRGNVIRIISARIATKSEKRKYEEGR